MTKDIIIGLKTLDIRAKTIVTPKPAILPIDLPYRNVRKQASKRRVFNEAEWQYLNSLPTLELLRRVGWGNKLIELLHNPAILNMTQKEADWRSSNLEYQIEAINHIIEERKVIHG